MMMMMMRTMGMWSVQWGPLLVKAAAMAVVVSDPAVCEAGPKNGVGGICQICAHICIEWELPFKVETTKRKREIEEILISFRILGDADTKQVRRVKYFDYRRESNLIK